MVKFFEGCLPAFQTLLALAAENWVCGVSVLCFVIMAFCKYTYAWDSVFSSFEFPWDSGLFASIQSPACIQFLTTTKSEIHLFLGSSESPLRRRNDFCWSQADIAPPVFSTGRYAAITCNTNPFLSLCLVHVH